MQNSVNETIKTMKSLITLKPAELKSTREMQPILIEKLIKNVVNSCIEKCYVCDVTEVDPIENGKIGGHGEVDYIVNYKAKVFEPLEGQTLTGNIQKIIGNGAFVVQSPFRCFIAKQFFDEVQWEKLAINEPLEVILREFRFNKHEIMCIAEPVSAVSVV